MCVRVEGTHCTHGPLWPYWIQGRKQSLGEQAVPANSSEERSSLCSLTFHQKGRGGFCVYC